MKQGRWTDLVVSVSWGVVIMATAWVLKESPHALTVLLIMAGGATASVLGLCCGRQSKRDRADG